MSLYRHFFLVCCASLPLHSHATHKHDIFSLSLEELLTVSVMSQKEERIARAPGIVSTLNADELKAMGLYTLTDILSFLPGIDANKTLDGNTNIQMRGLSDAFNQKVLIMVDGTPYWMPSSADVPLNAIPFAAIEKVEVIRGPASFIYGTNASAGVINIITRKSDKQTIETILGADDYHTVSGYSGHNINEKAFLSLAAEIHDEKGFNANAYNATNYFDPSCSCFPRTLDGTLHSDNRHKSLIGRAQIGNISGLAQWHESQNSGGADGSILSPHMRDETGILLGLSYQNTLGIHDFKINTDWNNYHLDYKINNMNAAFGLTGTGRIYFENEGKNNTRLRSATQITSLWHNNISTRFSLDYEERSTDAYKYTRDEGNAELVQFGLVLQADGEILLIEKAQATEWGSAFQVDYRNDHLTLVGGARYTNNSRSGDNLSPRLSAVYQLTDNQTLKAHYAAGFSAPTFRQTAAVNQFGVPVENSLSAEKVKSSDLAWAYDKNSWHMVINAFNLQLKDGLNNEQGVYRNVKQVNRQGLEFDLQWQKQNWRVYSNISALSLNESDDDPSAAFQAKLMSKVGGHYSSHNHGIGMSLRTASSRASTDGYYWLNMNYKYTFNKFSLGLVIDNLLDNSIYTPDYRSFEALEYEISPGRRGFLTLSLNL